jgi:uncharacterized caspase-like protein
VVGAKTLRLVIADIGQDDPLTGKTTASSPAHRPAPGVLVLLSAAPGQPARDRQGRLSPFAQSVAQRLAVPKQDVGSLAQQVRDDVLASTRGRQEPRLYGLNTGSVPVYLGGP